MELAILLSLAASVCTATSSVCQRLGARHIERCGEMRGFDAWLVFRLARQPVWLLGFVCMLGGFGFQITALRYGPLALVQPILAMEKVRFVGEPVGVGEVDHARAGFLALPLHQQPAGHRSRAGLARDPLHRGAGGERGGLMAGGEERQQGDRSGGGGEMAHGSLVSVQGPRELSPRGGQNDPKDALSSA